MLSPQDIGARLKALREEAHLSAEVAARAAGVPAEELLGIEAGEGRSLSALIRVAQVYGLTEVDLYAPQAPAFTAVSVILRGESGDGELALHLGRFAVICREYTELEDLLKVPARGQITRFAPAGPPSDPPYVQAEDLADRVRQALRLGVAPIRSMVALLSELGIRLVWTERLPEDVKGLSFHDPRVGPSVVVNASRRAWWTLRSTIAHELCHILFDRVPASPFGTVSRRAPSLPLEQRADAFAYYFLAPREGVQHFFETRGRTPFELDRSDVHAFANHFALGIEAATWHLKHLGWLTEQQRRELVAQRYPIEPDMDTESPWASPELAPFMALGVELERLGLVPLALTAYARDLITQGRLREVLGLSPFDDLEPLLPA
jgi:Zn-dependent peptidase ImmA (M78 family)/transcriptional regulator with XRE-family HTH domain